MGGVSLGQGRLTSDFNPDLQLYAKRGPPQDSSEHAQQRQITLALQILPAAHFAGRCKISARACNRFESTALFAVLALSFSDRAKLWSFASSLRFSCELSAL
jgi:hypothetical protein